MGLWACLGVILPFPFYYWLWAHPQTWVDLCGRGRDPCRVMAMASHFIKFLQFISLLSVSTFSWPPPLYFWPLFIFGQFLNFSRLEYPWFWKAYESKVAAARGVNDRKCCNLGITRQLFRSIGIGGGHSTNLLGGGLLARVTDPARKPYHWKETALLAGNRINPPYSSLRHNWVYQLLGEAGTYYGVRFGKSIPWVTEFPFGVIRDPQYVGSILSLLACLSWVPFLHIFLWVLGYVFMIQVESKDDPATRAKPLS